MADSEPTSKIIRPVRSGQITIPAEFREKLGITSESLLRVTLLEGELRIRPVRVSERTDGSVWLKDLYDRFAPMRDEASTKGYSEAEIDTAIDEAVQAVRRSHG